MRNHTRKLALIAGAMALALTGCSDDGDGKGSTSVADYGPLDEYLSQIYGYSLDDVDEDQKSTQDQQAEMDEKDRQVEELVAECMRGQGFDYTPNENNGSMMMSSDDIDLGMEWDSREFAETYGYSMANDPWQEFWDDQQDDADDWTDPNEDYVNSMSESERDAYYEAMYGEQPDDDDEEAWETWEGDGCYDNAYREVWDTGSGDGDEFSDLEDEISSLWEAMETHTDMVALDAEWAACMADAGFSGLTRKWAAQDMLIEEWDTIHGWNDPEREALFENWDWDAKPDGPPEIEPDPAEVEAFAAKEIAQAVADWDCTQEIDFENRYRAMEHKMQQEFVDSHRAELDAWVEYANANRDDA